MWWGSSIRRRADRRWPGSTYARRCCYGCQVRRSRTSTSLRHSDTPGAPVLQGPGAPTGSGYACGMIGPTMPPHVWTKLDGCGSSTLVSRSTCSGSTQGRLIRALGSKMKDCERSGLRSRNSSHRSCHCSVNRRKRKPAVGREGYVLNFVVMRHRRAGELGGLPVPIANLPTLMAGEPIASVGAETNREQAPEVARMRQWLRQRAARFQAPNLSGILDERHCREEPAFGRNRSAR
jgi:hypothetical protein